MKGYKGFLAGMLTMLLLVSLVGTAGATYGKVKKELEYRNIRVTLNGQKLDLKDATGKTVEPFMFDGTNYLPVRALSESLGLDVSWDGNTNTVVLTGNSHPSSSDMAHIKLMGFYKILEENLSEIAEIYLDFTSPSKLATYTDKSPVTADNQSMATATKSVLKKNLELAEGHYSGTLSEGLLSQSDIELMMEYRRLENRLYATLSEFEKTPSSSYLSNISGAAYQNHMDTTLAHLTARTAFWDTYQAAF